MATIIKLKRGTGTPTTSDLANGEVGIDTSAKILYINDGGTIKAIGGSSSGDSTSPLGGDIRTATGGTDVLDLGAGEFAFFPWSADVDLAFDAASGTPTMEVRVYQATAA